jgi:hypothetical protein
MIDQFGMLAHQLQRDATAQRQADKVRSPTMSARLNQVSGCSGGINYRECLHISAASMLRQIRH